MTETTKPTDGGPAYPETRWDDKTRQEVQWCGMSLRAYIAAQVLPSFTGDEYTEEGAAMSAVRYADALIAELNE